MFFNILMLIGVLACWILVVGQWFQIAIMMKINDAMARILLTCISDEIALLNDEQQPYQRTLSD